MILTLLNTLTADGDSTLSFTSQFTSTYDEYMFVFTDINPATDEAEFQFQGNASGQSGYNETITSTYFRAENTESDSDGTIGYETGHDQGGGTGFQTIMHQLGNGSDESGAGILHLFTPSNTTYLTHFYSRSTFMTATPRCQDSFMGGFFDAAAAITNIQFKMDSGDCDGVIQLYGIA